MHISPFGSILAKDLTHMMVLPNWLDVLKKDVEEGKRLTSIGSQWTFAMFPCAILSVLFCHRICTISNSDLDATG